MSILPHRSRRVSRSLEIKQQLLAFYLRQQWFAFPLLAVHKVVSLSDTQGCIEETGSVAVYQGESLLIVNLNTQIFKEAPPALPSDEAAIIAEAPGYQRDLTQGYLMIVKGAVGTVGFPIASAPKLCRVPQSAFVPLPEAYVTNGNLCGVSAMVVGDRNEPPLFLLDPDRLL